MAFRNPSYLDTELLSNLADYYGVDLPDETSVTRRSVEEGTKGAGINKIVTAKAESSRADEVTETYSVIARPVRLMNDLIDHVESTSELADLDADPEATITRGALVQINGEMLLSAANEVGSIMARFLPLVMAQFSAGATDFNPSQAEIAEAFTAQPDADQPQLFELEPEATVEGRRCMVLIDPTHLPDSSTPDDLEGEQTVVAHVDRLVRPGSELSLEKYLLPGMSRTVRRALSRKALADMVEGLDKLLGRKVGPEELVLTGPALLLRPLAVF